jgi:hypothetical protein
MLPGVDQSAANLPEYRTNQKGQSRAPQIEAVLYPLAPTASTASPCTTVWVGHSKGGSGQRRIAIAIRQVRLFEAAFLFHVKRCKLGARSDWERQTWA